MKLEKEKGTNILIDIDRRLETETMKFEKEKGTNILIDMYAYCPVNVSRAVGPRCIDRAINNLSND